MLKKLLFLLLPLFICPSLYAQPAKELGYWDYIQSDPICNSVPMLRVKVNGEVKWYGTAVVIDDHYAITCDHCIRSEAPRQWRRFSGWQKGFDKIHSPEIQVNGNWQKGKVVKSSKEFDLALVYFDQPLRVEPIKISRVFHDESSYQHIGRAGQGVARHFFTHNIDSEIEGYNAFEGEVIQGDSGGAILNMRNQLVGIISAGAPVIDKFENAYVLDTTYAVTLERIHEFLDYPKPIGSGLLGSSMNCDSLKACHKD